MYNKLSIKNGQNFVETTLSKISIVKDGTHSSPQYLKEGFPLITSKNLLENGKIEFKDLNYISKQDFDEINKRSKVEKGDILFGMIGTIGNPVICENDNFAIKNVALIKAKPPLNTYIFYYLKSKLVLDQFKLFKTGGTQKFIALNKIRELKILLPDLATQQKISLFFSAIDDQIDSYSKQLKLFDNLRISLLENSFKSFIDSEFLKNYYSYQEGPGVTTAQYTLNGVKLMNVGNLEDNEIVLENTTRYVSNETAYGPYKHFLVDEGDLIIASSGINASYFDKKIAFVEKKHLPLLMNTSTIRFKAKTNFMKTEFLYFYFRTKAFRKMISKVMTGSAQFNFGPSHIDKFKIPKIELKKQEKIVGLFSLMDRYKVISIKRNRQLNLLKKYYLEKIFKEGE